jgi:exopolysaccharide biosynthesis polyprenyl glycosylphosphotransferase
MKSYMFRRSFIIDATIVLMDILMIVLSYNLAVRSVCYYRGMELSLLPNNMMYIYCLLTIILIYGFDLYSIVNRKKYDIMLSVFFVVLISSISAVLINFFLYPVENSRTLLIIVPLFNLFFLELWRLFLSFFIRFFLGKQKLLVIEAKGIDNALVRKIKYSCLDLFDPWYTQISTDNEKEIDEFLKNEFTKYQCIFVTQSIPYELRRNLISEAILANKEIYVLPSLYDINLIKYEMFQFDDIPSLKIKKFILSTHQRFYKRAMDLVISTIGIILAMPFIAIIAIAIKISSPGPVFYSQERVTIDRKIFKVLKFRTMIKDAEKETGPVLASDDDPRITKIGRLLRALRLDELPQLFNIFIGDMSVVGPRPERPMFVDEYCDSIENYSLRYAVKAGLTGYAQVYGRYDTDAKNKLLYDLLYIREYSFLMDIKIILLTLKIMFVKESSEGVSEDTVKS